MKIHKAKLSPLILEHRLPVLPAPEIAQIHERHVFHIRGELPPQGAVTHDPRRHREPQAVARKQAAMWRASWAGCG